MQLINDFVRLKIETAFDLSESSSFESNKLIDNLRTKYLDRLSIELEYTWFDYEELRLFSRSGVKLMSVSNEDLFKKFYNDEKVLISSMNSDDFRIHEEELAKIAFEAKARIIAVVDTKRERDAILRANQKEWLVPRSDAEDQLVSDAINTVQSRKKRMNKVEKLNDMLSGFVDEETRKKIISDVERKATEKFVNLISFVKSKETEAKKEIEESKSENTEPFDPTKLKFGV